MNRHICDAKCKAKIARSYNVKVSALNRQEEEDRYEDERRRERRRGGRQRKGSACRVVAN